ncbi:MAG: hypothetical protein ACI4IF_06365 [Acutalibacteraceae bacterium]
MKKQSLWVLSLVIVTLVILLTGCSNNNNTQNAIDSTSQNVVKDNENSTIANELSDNGNEVFSYPIKDSYSSREEIEAEKDAITKSYLSFKVGKDTDTCTKAKETYNEYMKTMQTWLDKYPPESQEIMAEKERLLNQFVFFEEEALYVAENNLEKNSPDEAAKELDRAEKNYQKAVDVQKQYKDGEITIDEALEILDIPPSKMLQNYYEQNTEQK